MHQKWHGWCTPHQLFDPKHLGSVPGPLFLIEDGLFFGDHIQGWTPHKQKLWLHRSSMKRLRPRTCPNLQRHRIPRPPPRPRHDRLGARGHRQARTPSSGMLRPPRLSPEATVGTTRRPAQSRGAVARRPMFLNTPAMNSAYREEKSRWFMADYYKFQRRRLNVLMEGEEPAGGQWSFDEDNRKKVPKAMLSEIPELPAVDFGEIEEDARKHVEKNYPAAAGNLSHLWYPTTREQAKLGCNGSSTNGSTCLAPTKMPSSRTKTGCGTACSPLPSTSACSPQSLWWKKPSPTPRRTTSP